MSSKFTSAEQAGYLDAKDRAETGNWQYTYANQTNANFGTPNPEWETAYASGVTKFQQEQG